MTRPPAPTRAPGGRTAVEGPGVGFGVGGDVGWGATGAFARTAFFAACGRSPALFAACCVRTDCGLGDDGWAGGTGAGVGLGSGSTVALALAGVVSSWRAECVGVDEGNMALQLALGGAVGEGPPVELLLGRAIDGAGDRGGWAAAADFTLLVGRGGLGSVGVGTGARG